MHHLRGDLRGFTLIEVLIAMLIMSIMAVMSWQSVDGMVRTRDASQLRLEATLRVNTVLAQWQQDLGSVQETARVPGLRFDGATFQLTRRAPGGLQLVVWSLRSGRLLRWAAPPVTGSRELQELWLRSQQLQGSEPTQVLTLEGVSDWQVYFYRGNAWTNAQSSGDLVNPGAGANNAPQQQQVLPSGVRLVLGFADDSRYNGNLTRDTLIGPQ